MNKLFFFIVLSITIALLPSCKSDYEKWVSTELGKGVRNDSLLLGIHFGMTRSDFYNHCLELNRNNLITNGPENSTAQIVVTDYEVPIDLNFYPDFEKDKIHIMRLYFNYKEWAPWNKEYSSEKLRPNALDYLTKKYGSSFKELKTPSGKPFWLSINGNRQIRVFLKDSKIVAVDISDLTVTLDPNATKPNHPVTPQ
jgi:hypothetical protein